MTGSHEKKTTSPAFDLSVLALLACPACLGALELAGERLLCTACRRVYPIIDGIPALIVERAKSPADPPEK